MGLEELIRTLKKNEQQQIDEIGQKVKSEAETLRKQVAETIAAITSNHSEQLASACQKSMRSIFSATEIKAREKKLFAYQALDQALHKAARKELPALREKQYENVFANLVQELPELHWEKIIVNPDDQQLAAKFFAASVIQTDPAISGGLLAVTAENKIIVDNTFEKRLERKWRHLLPAVIAKIEEQYEETRSAENSD